VGRQRSKWLKGCALGCGGAVALGLVLVIGSGVVLTRSFNGAVDTQQELTRALGAREAWEPGPDGPTPERLAAFMAVRRTLAPFCAGFTAASERFRAMDEIDRDGDVTATEALKALAPVLGSIAGMTNDVGRFAEARNRALLEQGMSLGEYAWLYVLVYNSWLGLPANLDPDDAPSEAGYGPGQREFLAVLLESRADALAAAGRSGEAAAWHAEAAAADRWPDGVPFAGGRLPADLAACFEPHRDELAAAWCAATGSLELAEVRREGLSIHAR
jgi:hypothetical protein